MKRSATLNELVLELQRALLEMHKATEPVEPLAVERLLQDFRMAQACGHSVESETISPKSIRRRLK